MKYLLLIVITLWLNKIEPEQIEVEGFMIEYEIKGRGEHTILLEGGARAGLSDWDSIFDKLSGSYRVIRYARVGNGNSTQVKRHFTSLEYATYAYKLLEKLGVKSSVVLVAHSYGGNIARDFSASYPAKVKGLLLLDPSSEHDVDIMRSIDLEKANKEIAAIKLADMAEGMSNNYLDFWSKRPLPDYPQIPNIPVTVIASVRKSEHPSNLFFSDEGRKRWGEHWKNWAQEFPKGKAVLTEESGHFIQIDQSQLVIKELHSLVESL